MIFIINIFFNNGDQEPIIEYKRPPSTAPEKRTKVKRVYQAGERGDLVHLFNFVYLLTFASSYIFFVLLVYVCMRFLVWKDSMLTYLSLEAMGMYVCRCVCVRVYECLCGYVYL